MNDTSKKIFIAAFLLSLLFHGMIFIFFLFSDFSLFANTIEPEIDKKIRIHLQKPTPPPTEPQPQQPMPQIPETFTRLVENPNANEKNPDKTSLLSNKSSVSAALEAGDKTEISSMPSAEKNARSFANDFLKNIYKEEMELPYKTFSKGRLTTQLPAMPQQQEKNKADKAQNNSPSTPDASPDTKIKVFDPKEVGAFALNTYEWEYAPYMTAWLRYLQQRWIAPPAYTQLGIIFGATYVKFKIFPDGHMEAMEILQHEGHESLQLSSTNAVDASFPFKPLPEDFPEEYLEITLKLIYPDLKRLAR